MGGELPFSRVQPLALATQAFNDFPLVLFSLTSFVLPSRGSSTFSIDCARDLFQATKNASV